MRKEGLDDLGVVKKDIRGFDRDPSLDIILKFLDIPFTPPNSHDHPYNPS